MFFYTSLNSIAGGIGTTYSFQLVQYQSEMCGKHQQISSYGSTLYIEINESKPSETY